jgi:alpha-beta hydrolase superfamily lysophospholipase
MVSTEFSHSASDGKAIFVRAWRPSGSVKALLVVAHGMAEHSGRYERLAEAMTGSGWAVFAPDHRGHGRSAGEGELGWMGERDGFARIRADLHEVAQGAAAEYPGLPVFLLGHSMGSLLAEAYIAAYGLELSGCALTGVISPPSPMAMASARLIAALGSAFKGQKAPAASLHKMSFEASNKDFQPARTPVDWLSRDAEEVDRYIADPRCGFVCSFGFYRDFISGFSSVYRGGAGFSGLPKSLPLFIAAGAEDPVGGAAGFVSILADKYKTAGLQDIETRLYPGARHEILNETNRAEVIADVKLWLEAKLRA